MSDLKGQTRIVRVARLHYTTIENSQKNNEMRLCDPTCIFNEKLDTVFSFSISWDSFRVTNQFTHDMLSAIVADRIHDNYEVVLLSSMCSAMMLDNASSE